MPIRIQRKRVKGWKKPTGVVNCSRPGIYGNPFKLNQVVHGKDIGVSDNVPIVLDNADKLVLAYRYWLDNTAIGLIIKIRAINELKGKDLMCFCRLDQPCHADILLKIANE